MSHGSERYGPSGAGGNGNEKPCFGIDCYVRLFLCSTWGGASSCRRHPGHPWRSGEWRGYAEVNRGRARGRRGGHGRSRCARGSGCELRQAYKRDDFPLASKYCITVYQLVSSDVRSWEYRLTYLPVSRYKRSTALESTSLPVLPVCQCVVEVRAGKCYNWPIDGHRRKLVSPCVHGNSLFTGYRNES